MRVAHSCRQSARPTQTIQWASRGDVSDAAGACRNPAPRAGRGQVPYAYKWDAQLHDFDLRLDPACADAPLADRPGARVMWRGGCTGPAVGYQAGPAVTRPPLSFCSSAFFCPRIAALANRILTGFFPHQLQSDIRRVWA